MQASRVLYRFRRHHQPFWAPVARSSLRNRRRDEVATVVADALHSAVRGPVANGRRRQWPWPACRIIVSAHGGSGELEEG